MSSCGRGRWAFLALALAAGCGNGASGPAGSILLTLRFASDVPSDRVLATRALTIAVDGAETYHVTRPVQGEFAAGEATVRYFPGVTAGTLHFTATASDGAGVPVAAGDASVRIDPAGVANGLIVLRSASPMVDGGAV